MYESIDLNDGNVLKIYQDEYAENPRNWDNLGTMVCFHRRYSLGDEHDYSDPDEFKEWWEEHGDGGIRLPLYLYDHSGITIRTTPFSCPWDSGQVGYIYVTVDRIREEYREQVIDMTKSEDILIILNHGITEDTYEKVRTVLEGEVKTYDQYLTGDIYFYVLENSKGEIIDSCGGFYGHDPKSNGMLDHIDEKYHAVIQAA